MFKNTFLRFSSCILSLLIFIGSLSLMPTTFAESSAVTGKSEFYDFGFCSEEFATPDEEEYATPDEEATMTTDCISDPEETAPPTDLITLYFENTEGWSDVYCHAWNNMGATTLWPGVPMEDLGNNIYKAVIDNEFTTVVFNNGTVYNSGITPDSYIPGDKMLYSNGTWYGYEEFTVDIEFEAVRRGDGSYDHHIIRANVSGGTAPYTYRFSVGANVIVWGSESNEIEYTFDSDRPVEVSVSVSDSENRDAYKCVWSPIDGFDEVPTTSPDDDSYTLYFRNHDKWNIVNAYTWCDGDNFSQPLGMWPGTACKYIHDDIWAIEVTDNFDYIIFNDLGKQTTILPNPGGFNVARWVSTDGFECEYEWEFPIITDPTETTQPTEPLKEDVKVYFDNSESYNQVFAYAWGDEDFGEFSQWPGVLCTDENNGTWSVVIPGRCDYVLFHNGNGIQTNNLVNPEESKIAKVVAVEDGFDVYDWFDVEEITTAATDPTEATDVTEPMGSSAPSESNYLLGDANLDGKVNIFDVTVIDKYSTNDAVLGNNPIALKAADYNENSVVNFVDAIALQEYLASKRNITPEFSGATADGVNIDGKNYPVEKGGIYTYKLFIDTPRSIENIQAYVAYDAEKLRLIDEYGSIDYPLLVSCTEGIKEGLIAFNFSTVGDRYNFAGGKILVKLQFEVIDSSASEIVAVIENMAEYGGSIYFEDGEKKNDDVNVYHTFESDYAPSESEFDRGDVDLDGKVSIFDATLILKHIAKLAEIEEKYWYLADVNLDEKINIRDASAIQKYLALIMALDDGLTIVPEFAGATEDGVNIDGKNYSVKEGSIFTYKLLIDAPKNIESIQAYVAYDSDKLRPTRDVNWENCPNLMGGLLNAVDGLIVFNAAEITGGYDFTNGKVVLEVQFEVLDSSASEIVAVVENMAEFFGLVYFEDNEKKNDDVKVYHSFELDFTPTEPATEDEPEPETTEATEPVTAESTAPEATKPTEDKTTVPAESETTEATAPVEPEFETGDVNCDGKLNIKDVTIIQKFLAKLLEFTEEVKLLADYNGDGLLNIKDATTIQKKLANLI